MNKSIYYFSVNNYFYSI